ncbi:hypothetical protein [Agromyces archimandritae]|uniref:Trypsin-like serine protease n=1 Tax=Agromyces archimandritae TaxID=2781962 RepID=A0A975FQL4_9MICO|nr:hypothetical protein [Agromyces archimandritae]QTX05908.1 hypothetical protein G127AT_06860 [Agromyces archimandritae]
MSKGARLLRLPEIFAAAAALIVLGIPTASVATEVESHPEVKDSQTRVVEVSDFTLPEGHQVADLSKYPDDGMTTAQNEAMNRLVLSEFSDEIVTFRWNKDTKLIEVIAGGNLKPIEAALEVQLHGNGYKIVPSRFTGDELRAEATRVAKEGAGKGVGWAAAANDGSGIVVGVTDASTGEQARLRAAPVVDSDYPLTFEPSGGIEAAYTRYNGSDPAMGGSVINGENDQTCSAAFYVLRPENPPTFSRSLLTAEHCGNPGEHFRGGWGWEPNGSRGIANNTNGAHDTMVLTQTTGSIGPYMFLGGPMTSDLAAIKGWAYAALGSEVVPSGAYSGATTWGTVTQSNITVCVLGYMCWENQVRVKSSTPATQAIYGQGDSGGPVIRIVDGQALATGVISTIDTSKSSACMGYDWSGRQCATEGTFQTVSSWLAGNPTWAVATAP